MAIRQLMSCEGLNKSEPLHNDELVYYFGEDLGIYDVIKENFIIAEWTHRS